MLAPGALHVFTHLAEDVSYPLQPLAPTPPAWLCCEASRSVCNLGTSSDLSPAQSELSRLRWGQHSSATLSSGKEVLHSLSLGSAVQEGRACRGEQCVSFPAVFSGSNAAACLWVPMGTALLRTVDPLEGFGLHSSL